jgi:dolichyl-phosphate beta-glucosyltransferase
MAMDTVTLILPLYKPRGNWAEDFVHHVQQVNQLLPGEQVRYIVVHDGVPCNHMLSVFDVISEALPEISFVHYNQNRGKGYALRYGVNLSETPYTIMVDFDFPYEIENIATVLTDLKAGRDVVVGRRSRAYFRNLPLTRKIISRSYSLANRVFFTLPVYDTQSGLKGFNHLGRDIFLQTFVDRFLIDTEFLLRAARHQLRISVIEVQLRAHVTFSNFGWKVLKTETGNLVRLLRLNRQLRRQLRYGHSPLVKARMIS